MKTFNKSLCLALALGAVSGSAFADDLIGTHARGKGGVNTYGLDLVTTSDSTAVEFVLALPKGATDVDVSSCMKSLPSTHSGQCSYNAQTNEVIAIAFSASNAKLPQGVVNLGTVRYKALQKGNSAATIRGLVVADGKGNSIPSEIQTEDASLGK